MGFSPKEGSGPLHAALAPVYGVLLKLLRQLCNSFMKPQNLL